MAITRAQQAKQLLANGGRIGLKGGADAATESFAISAGGGGQKGKDYAASVGAKPDPVGGFDLDRGQGPTFDGAEATIATGDDFRKAQEDIGKAKLKNLYDDGVPKSNVPGMLGYGLNSIKKLRDFTLRKNIEYFEDLSTSKYPKTLEGYTQYMQDRSAGLIDAAGNTIMTGGGGDDPFIPINQMSTNMDQAPEEVLSPIQQAILDRGDASAFLATGGRVGFKGGADMGTVSTPTRAATAKSVNVSPSGGVTTSTDKPEGPDDRGNNDNRPPPVKKTIPPEIKKIVDVGGDISYLKNLIELNPVGILGNIGGRILFDKIIGDQTSLDTEDDNMQMAELSQKQLNFLNSPKIQRDLKEFGREPKAVFDMLPDYEEKPFFGPNQEPTTPEEFNQYLDSINVP